MKKISYLLLVLAMVVSSVCLTGCGEKDNNEGKTTTKSEEAVTTEKNEETTTVDNSKVTYKIKVVDESGAGIADAMVQLCKDACVPGKTDANGVAEFVLAEDAYKASVLMMPEGYTYSGTEEEFYFADGETEITITLKAQ